MSILIKQILSLVLTVSFMSPTYAFANACKPLFGDRESKLVQELRADYRLSLDILSDAHTKPNAIIKLAKDIIVFFNHRKINRLVRKRKNNKIGTVPFIYVADWVVGEKLAKEIINKNEAKHEDSKVNPREALDSRANELISYSNKLTTNLVKRINLEIELKELKRLKTIKTSWIPFFQKKGGIRNTRNHKNLTDPLYNKQNSLIAKIPQLISVEGEVTNLVRFSKQRMKVDVFLFDELSLDRQAELTHYYKDNVNNRIKFIKSKIKELNLLNANIQFKFAQESTALSYSLLALNEWIEVLQKDPKRVDTVNELVNEILPYKNILDELLAPSMKALINLARDTRQKEQLSLSNKKSEAEDKKSLLDRFLFEPLQNNLGYKVTADKQEQLSKEVSSILKKQGLSITQLLEAPKSALNRMVNFLKGRMLLSTVSLLLLTGGFGTTTGYLKIKDQPVIKEEKGLVAFAQEVWSRTFNHHWRIRHIQEKYGLKKSEAQKDLHMYLSLNIKPSKEEKEKAFAYLDEVYKSYYANISLKNLRESVNKKRIAEASKEATDYVSTLPIDFSSKKIEIATREILIGLDIDKVTSEKEKKVLLKKRKQQIVLQIDAISNWFAKKYNLLSKDGQAYSFGRLSKSIDVNQRDLGLTRKDRKAIRDSIFFIYTYEQKVEGMASKIDIQKTYIDKVKNPQARKDLIEFVGLILATREIIEKQSQKTIFNELIGDILGEIGSGDIQSILNFIKFTTVQN